VRYWDTSAVVALLANEARSDAVGDGHASDPVIVTWWATIIECESALTRRERQGENLGTGRALLDLLVASWDEIPPADDVRRVARRLVRVHPLRGADAFQLAAAITAADGSPERLPFVTLDARLADAASREGFKVIRPA